MADDIVLQSGRVEILEKCVVLAEHNKELLDPLLGDKLGAGAEVFVQNANVALTSCKDSFKEHRGDLVEMLGEETVNDSSKIEIIITDPQQKSKEGQEPRERLIPGDDDVEPQPESESESSRKPRRKGRCR